MLLNMTHEGLVFLRRMTDHKIFLNEDKHGKPLLFVEGQQIIATILYGNDALVIFGALFMSVLSDVEMLQSYGLSSLIDYRAS